MTPARHFRRSDGYDRELRAALRDGKPKVWEEPLIQMLEKLNGPKQIELAHKAAGLGEVMLSKQFNRHSLFDSCSDGGRITFDAQGIAKSHSQCRSQLTSQAATNVED